MDKRNWRDGMRSGAGFIASCKGAEVQGLAEWVLGLLRGRSHGHAARRQMELLETLSLGGRRQLMLVSCNGQRFVVGCGSEIVTAIVQVDGLPESVVQGRG